tara:strand:- start:564 stop:1097 length:534 start_codon:yes stop_codon:yes gene_type:complete
VRTPDDLEKVDALILPGGESTTMANLLQRRTTSSEESSLASKLTSLVKDGLPVWGTCAGMIILARELTQADPIPLGLMGITVNRNAFGRQSESFEQDLKIPELGEAPIKAIFIRAPAIVKMDDSVTVLARLEDGTPVAAKQNNMLVTAFHPELTNDVRFHQYFIETIATHHTTKLGL